MNSAGSLNPSTLAGTLQTEASNLSSYVPGSFLAGIGGTPREAIDRGETVVREEIPARGPTYASNVLHTEGPRIPAPTNRWVAPALLGLLGAAVLGWIVHRLVTPTTTAVVNETAQVATPALPPLGRLVNVALPNGTQLNVPENGVEVRLIQLLQHPDTQSGNANINFDRLLFSTDQTTLQPQSNAQLDNIAAILKAYPNVNCSLGGYTDNTGDPNANRQLSEQRANSVMTALVQRGVDPGRLTAHGYGEDDPVADNSTAAGRQMNRRVAIRVAEK